MMKKIKNYIQESFKKTQNGFTLVELLIYMGLLSIFIYILTSMFVSILEVKSESTAISAVEQDGRFLMSRLVYDINRASSIITPATLGESGNSLVLNIGGDTYTYTLVGNELQLTNTNGTDHLNSSEAVISSVTFQRLGNVGGKNSIKIQFTLNSIVQRAGGPETNTFNVTAGIR